MSTDINLAFLPSGQVITCKYALPGWYFCLAFSTAFIRVMAYLKLTQGYICLNERRDILRSKEKSGDQIDTPFLSNAGSCEVCFSEKSNL